MAGCGRPGRAAPDVAYDTLEAKLACLKTIAPSPAMCSVRRTRPAATLAALFKAFGMLRRIKREGSWHIMLACIGWCAENDRPPLRRRQLRRIPIARPFGERGDGPPRSTATTGHGWRCFITARASRGLLRGSFNADR